MLSEFIVSRFIKDYEDVEDYKVRQSYGFVGGVVGIIANLILFAIKFFVGLVTKSIAVMADAFNNLSDVSSSVITILGFKLSSKPADREHPFGHGRIEYISAMIVSFIVLLVGLGFIKSSFDRIMHPGKVEFSIIPFLLILFSMLIKIWLSRFNNFVGKSINSQALKASSFDALSDVFTSGCTAVSLLAALFTNLPIDGYVGILVSAFILYSGYSLIKDTLNPLLGEAPDPILVQNITKSLLEYEYITGVHDMIVHNYGPGRSMASLHAEVPDNISIIEIHEIIDKAEKELTEKYNIYIVIHMDPINTNNSEIIKSKEEVLEVLKKYPKIKSMHDFRVVGEGDVKNLIFDVVIDTGSKITDKDIEELKQNIINDIKNKHEKYNAVITIDKDFTAI